MIDLNDLRVLLKVVDAHSFTRAAEILDLPVSAVSSRITRLERALGAQLLERTTRKMRLTESGHRLYEQAKRSLAELDEVTGSAAMKEAQPQGRVRITTTSTIAQGVLSSVIPEFLKVHPAITLDVLTTTRQVDLIEEDFDLAIRVGEPSNNRLIAKPLGRLRACLYAAPRFFPKGRWPKHPRELAGVSLLDMGSRREQCQWLLSSADDTFALRFTPRLSSVDEQLLLHAALAGLGVASLPELAAQERVKQGDLQPVLPQWCVREVTASAVFPSHKGMSASARAFIDFLAVQWPR